MDKVTGQCPQATTFLKRKESRSGITITTITITIYFINPSGKLKLSFDRTAKKISQ